MIIYDLVSRTNESSNGIYIELRDGNPCVQIDMFDGSIGLLRNDPQFKYLMSYRVTWYNYYAQEPQQVWADQPDTADARLDIIAQYPTIFSRIEYWIKHKCNILRKLFNRWHIGLTLAWLLIDKYYLDENNIEYSYLQNSTVPAELFKYTDTKDQGGEILVYNADIVSMFGYGRYKVPIIRIWVYYNTDPNRYITDEETGIRILNIDETENPGPFGIEFADSTMVYTIEPEPKPLQPYDKIKKRLKGHIISEERLEEIVEFIKLNYRVFRAAWDNRPSRYGEPQSGWWIHHLKPLDPNVQNTYSPECNTPRSIITQSSNGVYNPVPLDKLLDIIERNTKK